ncbi:MAG: hypothetical protein ACKVT2_12715 [Saprospiraceae bacterium]
MNLNLRLLLFFFFSTIVSLSAQSWQKLGGPFGGGSIVYPGKPGFLFMILDDNELYRSSDAGLSWQKMPVTPANNWSSHLVVGADGNLYASKSGNIFRSVDNGQTWAQIGSITPHTIFAFPTGEILVGTYQGIKRSIDNGQTWDVVASDVLFAENFAYNPQTGDLYAWEDNVSSGELGKVWRSSDNGLTWGVMLEGLELQPYQAAFSPTGGIFLGSEDVIWRSLDNGATWTSIDPMFPNSLRDVSVAVGPTGRLFAFEWYLSKYSDDNGNTWKTLEDSGRNPLGAFSSTPDGKVFGVRSYGSLQRSDDGGITWQFSANGILRSSVTNLQHIDATHMLALTGDGLFYSKNSGSSWDLIWEKITEDVLILHGFQLQVAPDGSWYLWDGFDLLKFTDEGQSHTTLQIPGVNNSSFEGFWVSPITGKIFLTSWGGLFTSTDGGQTWNQLSNSFYFDGIVFMPDGSLIFSDYNGIYKSLDEGQTWAQISNRTLWPYPPVVSPNGILYGIEAGSPSSLFISPDGGGTWDSIPINSIYPIYSVIVNNAGFIYGIHDFENVVLRSVDGGYSFNPLPIIGDGYNSISDISLNPSQYLFNLQTSDGIYRSTTPTTQVKLLSGRTYHDLDGACSLSSTDSLLRGKIVKATKNGQNVYGFSNPAGQYIVPVNVGDYQISVVPPNDYWLSCGSNANIPNNNAIGIVDSADLGLRILTECPYAEVDVSAPFLRRCFESQIFVHFSNNGTIPADNASMEITLDSLLDFNSSSLPVSAQNGQTYTFQLGNLPVGGHGNMSLKVTPSCNAAMGYIHCLEAHIYPDELCPPLSGAHLVTSAVCMGDSVQLRIDNSGDADMLQPLKWYALDFNNFNFPFDAVSSGQFQLDSGEHFTKNIASGHQRLDFYAEQSEEYPFNVVSHTQIQGCGIAAGGAPLNIINDDDDGPFVDKFCVRNIGAYDPNDKQGFPDGLSEQGYIEREQTLEYLVRFQNTGTDTAFNVTIRDTLSALLDPASVHLGATSHPCELRMTPSGTLMLIFEHILLPDSNINEPASHGFAQFTIGQKSGNAFGSTIRNRAGIYFDFNPPVITNQTLHTVGIPLVTKTGPELAPLPKLSFSPNPFRESTLLTISGQRPDSQSYILELFDPLGKKVRSSTFSGTQLRISQDHLPNGAYQFVLKTSEGINLGSGTIVAQ